MSLMTILLIVLLIAAIGGGGLGFRRYGAASLSPLGLIVVVLIVMYFTGHLRV